MEPAQHNRPRDTRIARAVNDIVCDLQDRGNLGSEWDLIEADIREEIIQVWRDLISLATDPAFPRERAHQTALSVKSHFERGLHPEEGWADEFVRNEVQTGDGAKIGALLIITDLSDRRGLRQEYDQLDQGVQREIYTAWAAIIAARTGSA